MICRLFKKTVPLELPLNSVDIGHGLITAAISQIGLGERGSNNSGEHVERYAAAVNRNAPLAWCAAFVYWCYLESCDFHSVQPVVKHTAGAKRLCKNILAARGKKVPFESSKPGDIVLWNRGARNSRQGHVGILLSPNVSRQTFVTIEGNKGNFPANVQVYTHNNGEAQLLGFYRLPMHVKIGGAE